MKKVGYDSETYLIGPGAIIPKLVCSSFCLDESPPFVWATADAELEKLTDELFTPGNGKLIIAHNAAFDVCVAYKAYPKLRSKIWQKLLAGEVICTMIREQLLNLATHGKLDMYTLPDGSSKRLQYGLDVVLNNYTGIDISEDKHGDTSFRKNYHLLDGVPASKYPKGAYDYAADDSDYAIRIYDAQNERATTDTIRNSIDTCWFHTASAVALLLITDRGMATDPAEFEKLCLYIESQLSEENLMPLVLANVMEAAMPPTPYKQHEKKARALLSEWTGIDEDEIDFRRVPEALILALEDTGEVKIKAGTKSSIKTKQLKRYVVAAVTAKQLGLSGKAHIEALLDSHKDLESLREFAESKDVQIETTDGGDISTSSEVIASVADLHEVLGTYQHRQKLQKIVSTEIPRMMWEGKLADVIHFPYRTLLETGRTSSFGTDTYPSANGQNVDPRARGVYVPRPGYVLCSCDFSMLELVCVAETTFRMFGQSVHRDKINAGFDLHAYLGTRLALEMDAGFANELDQLGIQTHIDIDDAYTYFKTLEKKNPKFYEFWRKLAKPVGLGFPSGLGAATMVELAMKDPYNLDMLKLAADRFFTHPEEFDLMAMAYQAKKLHGMTKDNLEWTPMLKAVSFAMRLREIWLLTYPEMVKYFEAVRKMEDESDSYYFFDKSKRELFEEMTKMWEEMGGYETTGEQAPSPEDFGGTSYLCYTTPMGMHRAKCTYTAVSNGLCMQSPGAEGAKWAVIKTVMASLDPASTSLLANDGGFVVNFVHDELLVEILEDSQMHERAMEVRRLMEAGLSEVIKSVKVKAEPCLMRKWNKYAKPVYKNDRLDIWYPKEVAV